MSIIHLETSVDFINLPLWEEIKILKNSSRHIVMAACKNKYWWNIRLNYYMILYLYCVRFSSRQNYLSGLSTWMPTKNILIKKRRKNGGTNCKFFSFIATWCGPVWGYNSMMRFLMVSSKPEISASTSAKYLPPLTSLKLCRRTETVMSMSRWPMSSRSNI